MLILFIAANVVMLIVLVMIVSDAYQNEGGLIALIAFFIPFYALYYMFFKMGAQKKAAVTLWVFGFLLFVLPSIPAVGKALNRDDACDLITKEEIAQEFGVSASDPETLGQGMRKACLYRLQTDPENALMFRIGPCDADTITQIARRRGAFSVSEVGDEAASLGQELWVRKGPDCYLLSQAEGSPDQTLQARKRLLNKVLEKRK